MVSTLLPGREGGMIVGGPNGIRRVVPESVREWQLEPYRPASTTRLHRLVVLCQFVDELFGWTVAEVQSLVLHFAGVGHAHTRPVGKLLLRHGNAFTEPCQLRNECHDIP